MNIYLVAREDPRSGGRDQLYEAVVLATNPDDARAITALAHGDEGYDFWWTDRATVRQIGVALEDHSKPRIICRDFAPG